MFRAALYIGDPDGEMAALLSPLRPLGPPPPPTPSAVAPASFKLPPFSNSDPSLWCLQLDLTFDLHGVCDELTRFQRTAASLPPSIAAEVRDLLVTPPSATPYSALKATLVQRFLPSKTRSLHQLLHETLLRPGQRPSQLLRELKHLLRVVTGTDINPLLMGIFLQKLPVDVRAIVASAAFEPGVSVDSVAQVADSIVDVSSVPVAIPAVKPASPDVSALRTEVRRLAHIVHDLSANVPSSRCIRTRSPVRRKPSGPRPVVKTCHPSLNSVAPAVSSPASLLFARDHLSRREFLIDTGAEVSVLSSAFVGQQSSQGRPLLQAANQSVIRTFGRKLLTLDLGLN